MARKTFEWRHVDQHTTDEDWEKVKAFDAWTAVKAAAEDWDSEDRYIIRSSETHTFEVRDADGNVTRWSVWGESRPYYYAVEQPPQTGRS